MDESLRHQLLRIFLSRYGDLVETMYYATTSTAFNCFRRLLFLHFLSLWFAFQLFFIRCSYLVGLILYFVLLFSLTGFDKIEFCCDQVEYL